MLAREELILAALLLQVKTLLDNADGGLARATGRVTLVGRYLDTLADLVVNAAVFAALAVVTGEPLLALAAFVALTLVLAVDYNATELYREARGEQPTLADSRRGAPWSAHSSRSIASCSSARSSRASILSAGGSSWRSVGRIDPMRHAAPGWRTTIR